MTKKMSKTAALKKAAQQVSMYRQGNGWIVTYLDTAANAWRTDSREYHFAAARGRVKGIKAATALELMGYDLMDLAADAPAELVRAYDENF
ncbi:hypothetical protein D3C87_656000 [compost metagenome]